MVKTNRFGKKRRNIAAADAVTLGDSWLAPAIKAGYLQPLQDAASYRWWVSNEPPALHFSLLDKALHSTAQHDTARHNTAAVPILFCSAAQFDMKGVLLLTVQFRTELHSSPASFLRWLRCHVAIHKLMLDHTMLCD